MGIKLDKALRNFIAGEEKKWLYAVYEYSCFELLQETFFEVDAFDWRAIARGVVAGMGQLLIRTKPGEFVATLVPDSNVVYLFNSGMKIWTIGPTTAVVSCTAASGTRESSTDKNPLPSPPI